MSLGQWYAPFGLGLSFIGTMDNRVMQGIPRFSQGFAKVSSRIFQASAQVMSSFSQCNARVIELRLWLLGLGQPWQKFWPKIGTQMARVFKFMLHIHIIVFVYNFHEFGQNCSYRRFYPRNRIKHMVIYTQLFFIKKSL